MVCFNVYIFDRAGLCVFYHEYYRPKSVKHGAGSLEGDQKQMFGLFWTLNNFCATVDPKDPNRPPIGTPRKAGHGCKFRSFTTSTYKLHFLEVLSGFKIILNTSRETGDLSELLQKLYDDVFVEHVIKSPFYRPGEKFQSEQFVNAFNACLRQHGVQPAAPPNIQL